MKIAKAVIGLCTGALLLTGCMTEEPIKQRATDQRIELIGNSSFNIDLLSAKTLINDDGLLTVDAKVLLSRTGPLRWIFCGDPKVTVWYRFTWIDSKGNTTKAPQREMVTLPGSIIDLHAVAPEEKYINYRLIVSLEGPETDAEANKQSEEIKEAGEVKPAGKSEAVIVKKNVEPKAKPAEKKAEVKPAEAKPAEKKAEAKPVEQVKEAEAKPVEKKAETKPVEQVKEAEAKPVEQVKEAEAKPAAEKKSKQPKLTEPFD